MKVEMEKRRVVFHIDVNSAFVSWSAVKILSEEGRDIRLVPSVVAGDPEDRRRRGGDVGARSATKSPVRGDAGLARANPRCSE